MLVERLRKAGAIPIGKTNTPEFGMGSHTYNKVYGITRQSVRSTEERWRIEWRRRRGARDAACCRSPTAATTGGSLRNPGNFNNIVGMRPTVGLVPSAPNPLPLMGFAVNGPMARTVADTAFLLSVMAGRDRAIRDAFRLILQCFAEP